MINFKTEIDPVAVYAAVVATVAMAHTIYQALRTGPRLSGSTSANMKLIPSIDDATYISINVSNKGSRRTTVTTLAVMAYPSLLAKWRNRADQTFIIPNPLQVSPPKALEPGDYFIAMSHQTSEMVKLSNTRRVYIHVYYVDGRKPLRIRLRPIKIKTAS